MYACIMICVFDWLVVSMLKIEIDEIEKKGYVCIVWNDNTVCIYQMK